MVEEMLEEGGGQSEGLGRSIFDVDPRIPRSSSTCRAQFAVNNAPGFHIDQQRSKRETDTYSYTQPRHGPI